MSPWRNLERIGHARAQRENLAALHFGEPYPIYAGRQAYTLQFAPHRARYPLRLQGRAGGTALTLDCDAQALFPELAQQSLKQAGVQAAMLITQAFEDWLSVLEGMFGCALEITGTAFDVAPRADGYGLVLTQSRNRRSAYLSIACEVVDQWLRRQPAPEHEASRCALRLQLDIPLCRRGPVLTARRLRGLRRGEVLLLERDSLYLRLPLRHGARCLQLTDSGEHMVIEGAMADAAGESADMTSELIPTNALRFPFDAVIGSLSLSLYELTRLRRGSIVSLQLPTSGNSVVLLCQGTPFARGELIDIDDILAVRIVDLVEAPGPIGGAPHSS